MSIKDSIRKVNAAFPALSVLENEKRNQALRLAGETLMERKEEIFAAYEKDLAAAREAGLDAPILKRLEFNEQKLKEVVSGLHDLSTLPDPVAQVQMVRELDEGLTLYRESCPIGTIGIIFESRPDALVQISALCMKSGNCVILKGGSEALYTNRVLFSIMHGAAVQAGFPEDCMLQLEGREAVGELLECDKYVDLVIPRGSNSFVQYIMNHTRIPVMGHADGICHIYVDKDADLDKAIPILVDAKTQYVAACNTMETLLVHKDVAEQLLPRLKEAYDEKNVELRGTEEVQKIISCNPATEEDFKTEYTDYILSVKLVSDVAEAVDHINTYGSHHTDCIITENQKTADWFMKMVDSAGVYQNCSTRFADGYRYGFGAEVGISTGKIHARGPVGLEGLVTYKYKLYGSGQIVADYASGKKQFHFKDLKPEK